MKVHMWKLNSDAKDAFRRGDIDKEVYINQTQCGYVRALVTVDGNDVTCKLCIREMIQGRLK